MPTFKYRATDRKNKLITDTIEAASEKEAKTLLEDKDLQVLVLKNLNKGFLGQLSSPFGNNFPLADKVSLCRHLSIMISSGIALEEAFGLLITGVTNKTVKKVLQDVSFSLRKGQSLFLSFSRYSNLFGDIFLSMVKTGELSGTLDKSFNYLAQQFKQEDDLRKKIISALIYPAVIVCLMGSVGALMVTFVLPRLSKVFLTMDVELPIVTRLLLKASLFLEKNLLLSLAAVAVIVIAGLILVKSKQGKKLFYSLASRMPVLNKIFLYYNLTRFNQSLSALLKGGVSIEESLEISSQALIIPEKKQFSKAFHEKISKGLPLATVFSETKIFPPLMIQMVSVGEKTGNLEKILAEVALFYKEEVENSLKNFITLLEPLLMILVGIAVGVMVLAFISPIYSLIGNLGPK
ncbi:MAG: type II secretion system F family protein [Patescibacteria group bacterium]